MSNQIFNLSATAKPNNDQMKQEELNEEQRRQQQQMALASIFSSLTSLASSNQPLQLSTGPVSGSPTGSRPSPKQQQRLHGHLPQVPASLASPMALTSSLQSVMAAAMMQQQLAVASQQIQPEQQQQHSPTTSTSSLGGFVSATEHQQFIASQQQRINYCTICNKELCNKYFMKTHMFKMHGIKLEMDSNETSAENEHREHQNQAEEEANSEIDQTERAEREPRSRESGLEQFDESHSSSSNRNTTNNNSSSTVVKQQPTTNTQNSNGSKKSKSSPSAKQATSVLNGFAGNSMGGVVCDICNKELCSKYFLKVHKQNTHGITDYQDLNQFPIYPFAQSSPFIGSVPNLTPPNQSAHFSLASAGLNLNLSSSHRSSRLAPEDRLQFNEDSEHESSRNLRAKRPKLNRQQQQPGSHQANIDQRTIEEMPANGDPKQLESVYRMLIAQQQQQQKAPFISQMDPVATNPLGALMCFGTMGPFSPFGPAGMSPAMIVDHILKNQQLYNRNNNSGANSNAQQSEEMDRNNNNTPDSKHITTGAKNSKDSSSNNNSRYFTHYTEACPMCDRRFKSIKWLKTHMMNDHKQEIGTYMQMMMQYLYESKSQQMAAAATMVALEQQQKQQLMQPQNQSVQSMSHHQQQQLHGQQPSSLVNRCLNLEHSKQQFQQLAQTASNVMPDQLQLAQNQYRQHNKMGSNLNGTPESFMRQMVDGQKYEQPYLVSALQHLQKSFSVKKDQLSDKLAAETSQSIDEDSLETKEFEQTTRDDDNDSRNSPEFAQSESISIKLEEKKHLNPIQIQQTNEQREED